MRSKAVLFDVGGPIDTEIEHERRDDARLRDSVLAQGIAVDDAAYAAACRWAVESFAPNAYQAIVWRLCGADAAIAERAWRAFLAGRPDSVIQLREGIPDLLSTLAGRGVMLGLAANQPHSAIAQLGRIGLAGLFRYREVSGTTGFHKPDPRVFIHACEALGVAPASCLMVGDRIDNDIAPARMLGMATVRFVTGRHAAQRPRSWLEVPDYEVDSVAALARALDELLAK